MALALGTQLEHVWVELYGGAALLMQPGTAPLVYMAKAVAEDLIAELHSAGEAVTKAGGRIVDIPDLTDPKREEGFRRALFVLSLAELGAIDWRGVVNAADKNSSLSFDRARLAELFIDPLVSDGFSSRYLQPLHQIVLEGNV